MNVCFNTKLSLYVGSYSMNDAVPLKGCSTIRQTTFNPSYWNKNQTSLNLTSIQLAPLLRYYRLTTKNCSIALRFLGPFQCVHLKTFLSNCFVFFFPSVTWSKELIKHIIYNILHIMVFLFFNMPNPVVEMIIKNSICKCPWLCS